MNLIVCVDDKYGMAFFGKRQSRDKVQIQKMLDLVGENKLFISEYSLCLFEELPKNVSVSNDFLTLAKTGDFCFVERESLCDAQIEEIIIYKWNRAYPSDLKLSSELLSGKTLVSTKEFKGNSHEKITEEVYR